ncbi:hypothetical protein chiPu_0026147, partial [Chiloscyllium punctatum]|nr:hypothetical protein [Chiloscyllium punctatum]
MLSLTGEFINSEISKARELKLKTGEEEIKREDYRVNLKLFSENEQKLFPAGKGLSESCAASSAFPNVSSDQHLSLLSKQQEQASSLQTHITSEFTKMHQILTEKEQRLLRDLREEEERIVEPMEKELREIQENLSSIEEELKVAETGGTKLGEEISE